MTQCECRITGLHSPVVDTAKGMLTIDVGAVVITYCPLHAASSEMLGLLQEAHDGLATGWIENEGHRSTVRRRKLEAAMLATIKRTTEV